MGGARNRDEPGGLDVPPGFRVIRLRESKDALAHALTIAAREGAGTLVWVRRFDLVEIAVVLEPDEPLGGARRALYAVMTAAADAVAAHAPPEKPIEFGWPDTIVLDGGIIGGVRLAAPPKSRDDEVPDWLVAAVMLRTSVTVRAPTGGHARRHALDTPFVRGTSLEAEGFEMIDPGALIASFCRHLMLAFDTWRSDGFETLARAYLARMPKTPGVLRGIDGNGDLLERPVADAARPQRRPLVAALATPDWLDPETGAPWL